MPFVLIIHKVANYPAWKTIFDNAAGLRRDAGEESYQVLRTETDANQIVHFSRWRSLAAARAFFESEAVVRIRKDAGVEAPQFNYLEELEHGTLIQPRA